MPNLERPEGKWFISIDTLLIAILIMPNLWYNQTTSAMVMAAFGLYALVDIVVLLNADGKLGVVKLQRFAFTFKLLLLLIIIGITVLVPALYYVLSRPHGQPDMHLQDGAFQTEVALQYLFSGKNPYVESYVGTGLESYVFTDAPGSAALFSFAYFPFLLIFSAPFYWLLSSSLGWFDQRLVFLAAFIVVMILLPQLTQDPTKKLALVALSGLNFYTAAFLQEGRNDILVFLFLLIMIFFIRAGKLVPASLFLGLACAVKVSAWFVIPFVGVLVTGGLAWRPNAILWVRRMSGFWLALALTMIPFLIWNPGAFLQSTLAWTLGLNTTVYAPIHGYGFSALLLAFGVIKSPMDQFPLWIFQLLISLPILLFSIRLQSRHNTINTALFGYAAFFLVSGFFSRAFQNNYFHFALLLIFLAIFMDPFRVGSQQESTGLVPKFNDQT